MQFFGADIKRRREYSNYKERGSGEKPFKCEQEGCSLSYHNKQSLRRHQTQYHGRPKRTWPKFETLLKIKSQETFEPGHSLSDFNNGAETVSENNHAEKSEDKCVSAEESMTSDNGHAEYDAQETLSIQDQTN